MNFFRIFGYFLAGLIMIVRRTLSLVWALLLTIIYLLSATKNFSSTLFILFRIKIRNLKMFYHEKKFIYDMEKLDKEEGKDKETEILIKKIKDKHKKYLENLLK